LMAVFIVLPQVQVVLVPGIQGYLDFFREGPNWLNATRNSITVMLLSTTTAVLLGFVYAYAMVYSDMPWKPLFRIVAVLPMLSPPFVVAASYILLFGPRGLITYNVFGQSPNVLGLYGLWGVQTIAFFPYAYQLIADVLSRSDPRLEQAARNLGATPWSVFRTVTLPLARPGLVSAILLVGIYVVEDFGNPALAGLLPLVYGVLVLTAVVESYPFNFAPTVKHFEYVGAHFTSLRNSLGYASVAAIICALFSVFLGFVVQRKQWRGRGLVDF